MADERPLSIKRKFSTVLGDGKLSCIVHFVANNKDKDIVPLSDSQWETLRRAADTRQLQTNPDTRLDEICNSLPEVFNSDIHGQHRWCFKKFTNVSRLLSEVGGLTSTPSTSSMPSGAAGKQTPGTRLSCRQRTTTAETVLFPQDECLFCRKENKWVQKQRETLVKCLTDCAEDSIKTAAREKNDFAMLGRIEGMNLPAREARYHESCRRAYVRRTDRQHHSETGTDDTVFLSAVKSAYKEAFEVICSHVESEILGLGKVERMSMLRSRYIEFIQSTYPDYYNVQHKVQKLKMKLMKHYGDKLSFWSPYAASKSELVFSSSISTGEAIDVAFEAATSDTRILETAASILNNDIKTARLTSCEMTWPPSPHTLDSGITAPPASLLTFLNNVIAGRKSASYSARCNRLSSSIAQDICAAATQGQWVMPKHILLSMSLHHLTGSAEVITIVNRYGHCQSYSKVLELETAMATTIIMNDSVLPSNVSVCGNRVSHLCWDNFDVNESTPSGSGTTHTTHGIMIQEANADQRQLAEGVSIPKSKKRSFQHVPLPLPVAYPKKKVEPSLVVTKTTLEADDPVSPYDRQEVLWLMCRSLFNQDSSVPDWSGWLSKTVPPAMEQLSNVGYMTPIFNPATDYTTVLQCLLTSVEATEKVQQQYTFITFDLAMAKIAYGIVWDMPEKFANVIVHLGGFHTMCAYMGALGQMMSCSGFEDVVIESGICASGSIRQVMNGKHFTRSMRVHHHMMDAIHRLIMNSFVSQSTVDVKEMLEMLTLAGDPSSDNVNQVLNSPSCQAFFDKHAAYVDSIREGKHGCTAQFWLMYADCVWRLLHFLQSIKLNNVPKYIAAIRQMCPLMFAADRVNYSRYLPVYFLQLLNLDKSHPGAEGLLREGAVSVSRSSVPGCRNAVDLTIEQTINRSAKTVGGVIGFTRNVNAYHRWCLVRHQRALFLERMLDSLDMTPDQTDSHKTARPSEMRKSEQDVQRILKAFENYINPFQQEDFDQSLYCISSGRVASDQVARDLLQYVELGDRAVSDFIQTRLIARTVAFHDTCKKLSLKTFASMAVQKTLTSSQKKQLQVKAERNILGQLVMMSQDKDLDLNKLFSYPLSPVPWSIATADGCLAKTNKAQLMHVLELEVPTAGQSLQQPSDPVVVVDGNALLQSMVKLPETFGQFAVSVFNALPKARVVHFVTDSYHTGSIKEIERSRRGSSASQLIGGPMTKMPREFSAFMHNSDNKRRLIQFLLDQWQDESYAARLANRHVYAVSDGKCYCLTAANHEVKVSEVHQLHSSQEEADTKIILHCLYESQRLSAGSVLVVRSPDTARPGVAAELLQSICLPNIV